MAMIKKLNLIFFAVSLFVLSTTASQAVVELVDVDDTGQRVDIDNNITSGVIATGSGSQGDFEVIMCGTFSDGNNSFLDPAPGDWSTLDNGECGGNGSCILGIFGRSGNSADSSEISCNWTDPTNAFAAGSFRYSGVDGENPVIDIACETGGSAELVIAPSVITEPGSAVIRIVSNSINNANFQPDQILEGQFIAVGVSSQSGQYVAEIGRSFAFPEGGPTGDYEFGFSEGYDWRACTIALRMAPRNIPALSEWGLGIFAAISGIAAVWALRRRAVKV